MLTVVQQEVVLKILLQLIQVQLLILQVQIPPPHNKAIVLLIVPAVAVLPQEVVQTITIKTVEEQVKVQVVHQPHN